MPAEQVIPTSTAIDVNTKLSLDILYQNRAMHVYIVHRFRYLSIFAILGVVTLSSHIMWLIITFCRVCIDWRKIKRVQHEEKWDRKVDARVKKIAKPGTKYPRYTTCDDRDTHAEISEQLLPGDVTCKPSTIQVQVPTGALTLAKFPVPRGRGAN